MTEVTRVMYKSYSLAGTMYSNYLGVFVFFGLNTLRNTPNQMNLMLSNIFLCIFLNRYDI